MEKIIFYILLMTNFIIPFPEGSSVFIIFSNLLKVCLVLNMFLAIKRNKNILKEFSFILLIVIFNFVINGKILKNVELFIFLVNIRCILDEKIYFKQKTYKFLSSLCIISLILQLFCYEADLRLSFAKEDANYNALIALLFFYFSSKIGNKIGMILGVTTLFIFKSRTFFLAVLVFFIVILLRKSNFYYNKIFQNIEKNFRIYYFTLYVIFSIFCLNYTKYIEKIGINYDYSVGIDRIVSSYNDYSNYRRIIANNQIIEELFKKSNKKMWFSGYKNFDDYFFETKVEKMTPHNSFFGMIVYYGMIQSIFWYFFLFKELKRIILDNMEYILSFFIFDLFLFSGFSLSYVFLLYVYILCIRFKV